MLAIILTGEALLPTYIAHFWTLDRTTPAQIGILLVDKYHYNRNMFCKIKISRYFDTLDRTEQIYLLHLPLFASFRSVQVWDSFQATERQRLPLKSYSELPPSSLLIWVKVKSILVAFGGSQTYTSRQGGLCWFSWVWDTIKVLDCKLQWNFDRKLIKQKITLSVTNGHQHQHHDH